MVAVLNRTARTDPSEPAPPEVRPPRPAGGRWKWYGLGLLLPLAVALGAWGLRGHWSAAPSSSLRTAPVTRGTIEAAVLATGILKPTDLVAVGAQVSGRITNLAVELGQTVKAGDLIAEIDSTPQINALRKAEAALAQARAERAEQEATLANLRRTLDRQRALAARNTVPASDLDLAEADVAVSLARIAALDAQIEAAQVAVDTARVDLDYTRVTAPSDGTILAVSAQKGQTVNATQSAPTLVVLGALDVMSIEAEISEADVVHVTPGQPVWFTILGDPGTRHPATLASIAPAPISITSDSALTGEASDTTSSEAIYYNGKFSVPNPDRRLRTYMTAEVHIVLGQAKDVLTLPVAALGARNPDGTRAVQVLLPEGETETRAITPGLDDTLTVEVRSGLSEGEKVVLATTGDGPPPMGF